MRKKSKMRTDLFCIVALVLAGPVKAQTLLNDPFGYTTSEVYTRFVAKEYCSCRFVVQQSEKVCRQEAKAFSALVRVEEDPELQVITASNFFSHARAVIQQPSLGCQLFDAESVPDLIKDDSVEVEFGERMPTCHSRETLWLQLEISARDSEQTWLWPNDRSIMKGEGLFEGAKASVTYKHFLGNFEYGYRLNNVKPFNQFAYVAAEDHAFRGGAVVSLEEESDGSVSLIWQGLYRIPRSNFVGRQFFQNFSVQFFRDLKRNLEKSCVDLKRR